jgi:hypothetical protein
VNIYKRCLVLYLSKKGAPHRGVHYDRLEQQNYQKISKTKPQEEIS